MPDTASHESLFPAAPNMPAVAFGFTSTQQSVMHVYHLFGMELARELEPVPMLFKIDCPLLAF